MDAHAFSAQLPLQLTYSLYIWQRLDVADCSSDFGDDNIVLLRITKNLDVSLYLVRNMRDNLYGLSQIIATTLLVDDRLIDSTRGHIIGLSCILTQETLIMT